VSLEKRDRRDPLTDPELRKKKGVGLKTSSLSVSFLRGGRKEGKIRLRSDGLATRHRSIELTNNPLGPTLSKINSES